MKAHGEMKVPQEVTIDGKHGSAMWLTPTLLKVLFDDGSVSFLKPTEEKPAVSKAAYPDQIV
jgi:hypothetical protein